FRPVGRGSFPASRIAGGNGRADAAVLCGRHGAPERANFRQRRNQPYPQYVVGDLGFRRRSIHAKNLTFLPPVFVRKPEDRLRFAVVESISSRGSSGRAGGDHWACRVGLTYYVASFVPPSWTSPAFHPILNPAMRPKVVPALLVAFAVLLLQSAK